MASVESPRERATRLSYALFVPAILYARALFGDFLHWDDEQNIYRNSLITHDALKLIWSHSYYGLYIPVTYSFWTLLWHISHQPWIFHLANILIHALNTYMVYRLCRRLVKPTEHWAA